MPGVPSGAEYLAVDGLRLWGHAEVTSQEVSALLVRSQCLGSVPPAHVQAHEPDVTGFAERVLIQNGNAYEEGFTGVWDALRQALWHNRTPETERPLHAFLEPDGVKWIYTEGTRDPERISPDNWNLDLAVLARPNARRINLDLFYDYRTNTPRGTSTYDVTGQRP